VKKWITSFFMTWGMFCAIPCPCKKWNNDYRANTLLCLPLLGVVIGVIWAAAYWALNKIGCPNAVKAAVLAFLPWLLTGFIHLDGYMDCADAILSRRELKERQRILKDSTVGSFAVICFVLLAIAAFALFMGCGGEKNALCLLFVPVVSRCCSAFAVESLRPMGHSSYAAMRAKGTNKGHLIAIGIMFVIAVIVPCAVSFPPGLCGVATAAGSVLTIAGCYKDLDGMSGDISGCALTVGELCGAAVFALL